MLNSDEKKHSMWHDNISQTLSPEKKSVQKHLIKTNGGKVAKSQSDEKPK